MAIGTAHSNRPLPEALEELKKCGGIRDPRAILCFASTRYELGKIGAGLQGAFPEACVVGCTTAGEMASGQMKNGSVVAMFLDRTVVEDVAAVTVNDLRGQVSVREAFAELEQHFRTPVSAMDVGKYVGLVMVDGLSGAEERLMEKIGDRTDLLFVGGAAGDELQFRRTEVMANGKAHSDAAVLVLMRLRKGFEILKTQSFETTGKELVATAVEESSRRVLEFDHRPAAEVYADALEVPVEQLSSYFMKHPLGLMIGGEPFVRSPQRVDGRDVVFYCNVKEGMELEVLKATDIVADTREVLERRRAALGDISGLIDFHCVLRTLQLHREERCQEYGAIFSGIPSIGFSTYGEEFLGHINQTSTMLLFR